jgi:hypothetical protein
VRKQVAKTTVEKSKKKGGGVQAKGLKTGTIIMATVSQGINFAT